MALALAQEAPEQQSIAKNASLEVPLHACFVSMLSLMLFPFWLFKERLLCYMDAWTPTEELPLYSDPDFA